MARPGSCRSGFKSLPSAGGSASRAKGLDVRRMNNRNAAAIQDCTASTLARKSSGIDRENKATAAPNSDRTSTHKSIEPS